MPTRDRRMLLLGLRRHLMKSKFLGSGGSMVARLKLKELTEGHHQEWSLRLNLTQHGETYQVQT
ncbi:hornerin-like [Iris pallida]|uniref:Hornerin-like n=1 Tax=Iris pallida TaxID=29817 RepID=A0AAX6DIE3_IRIPA|nr:hornerin-like [Iris pallida]